MITEEIQTLSHNTERIAQEVLLPQSNTELSNLIQTAVIMLDFRYALGWGHLANAMAENPRLGVSVEPKFKKSLIKAPAAAHTIRTQHSSTTLFWLDEPRPIANFYEAALNQTQEMLLAVHSLSHTQRENNSVIMGPHIFQKNIAYILSTPNENSLESRGEYISWILDNEEANNYQTALAQYCQQWNLCKTYHGCLVKDFIEKFGLNQLLIHTPQLPEMLMKFIGRSNQAFVDDTPSEDLEEDYSRVYTATRRYNQLMSSLLHEVSE